MVKLSEFPEEERVAYLNRAMPEFDETPFVTGPPLNERRVSLISTAGLHRRGDRLFSDNSGDYRIISGDIAAGDLVMSHVSTNFDRLGFQQDPNVMLPLDRLKELADLGVISSAADFHFSFMGATPPENMQASIRDLIDLLRKDNVDAVVLCPV